MAVTAFWYGNGIKAAFNKEIDFNEATKIKIMLVTSSYTPAQTHDYKDDITNEITGTGYTAGGAELANCTVTYTSGTGVIKFDADDITWSTATITFRRAIVYYDTGTANTSPLITYIDFGEDVGAVANDFTIQFNAGGINTITATIA